MEMTKAEVEEKKLGAFIVMPDGCDINFGVYWRFLGNSAKVNVRYPHGRHGLAGKQSNSAKRRVWRTFYSSLI